VVDLTQVAIERRIYMKKMFGSFIVVGILLFGISAVMGMHHAIKIQEKEGIGKYLTDTEGKALYWFKKDSPGKSSCSGQCSDKWPIYYRETVAAPKDIKAEDFGIVTREDGKKQTTFRGYPLYYWTNDKKAGDTNGQGVNNVWFVINPDNFPPK
jgi:predicted lipoprotein with Yx(FWY)xxD motif